MGGEPFVQEYLARWVDMDFNQHMRNAAYLGCAEETRIRFLDAHGFGAAELARRQIGPVVLEDRLTYRRELRLLERFRVDLAVAGITPDARKMKVRNRFYLAASGAEVAVVDSFVLWFDIAARRAITPPDDLAALWLALARTEDFEPLG
jgi:acyl-CoA thioester hydrolase